MVRFWPIIVAGLLLTGCRSTDCGSVYARSPWEDAEGAKTFLNAYKHILVVCVYEDHEEDRGPHRYSLHHFKATVIRTFKGDWRIGERIALVHGVDAPAVATTNGYAGYLMFVFTNGHTNAEINVDAGDFGNYDEELGRVLQCAFPKR
jgi:hypothetical protein